MTTKATGMTTKYECVDMRDVVDDPLWAFTRGEGKHVLVVAPLERTRNLGPLAFPNSLKSGEPLAIAAYDCLNGCCEGYAGSRLEWFYSRWQPHNAASVLGLPDEEAPAALVEVPPVAFVYPWARSDPRKKEHKTLASIANENKLNGEEIDGDEGYVFYGPLSARKGELEITRIRRLIQWICNDGYQITKTSIYGQLMIRGNDWCIGRGGGNHRRSVVAALGFTHAPMRIKSILRREDVDSWPNVRSGLFTKELALRIFDRIFEGRQPAGCPSILDAPLPVISSAFYEPADSAPVQLAT